MYDDMANRGHNVHRQSCLVVVFSVIVLRKWWGKGLAPDVQPKPTKAVR